ncbi:MAG: hypothetical protein DRI90_18310 [Deltaproteobacteria bacterium]|nr:MAG: hypothetical protein DRI90_18310 [Deltaproteobacteria bacterium]
MSNLYGVVRSCLAIAALSGAVALAGVACGDDGDGATGGSGGTGAIGGSGGEGGVGGFGGTGATVTFVVMDHTRSDATRFEGAIVAFDAPNGQRTEKATGADGTVTFDGIDWSQGSAAATVHVAGHTIRSWVNLDEAGVEQAYKIDDALPLLVYDMTPPTAPATVTVSGTATGLLDTGHTMVVNVTNRLTGTEWRSIGTGTFTVTAPSGEPFTLQGMEVEDQLLPSGQGYDMTIHRVMHQSFDAVTDNQTGVVLDFATNEVSTQTADTFIATPSRADSPVRSGFAVALVCPLNSAYCTGWGTHVDIATDGNRFDASLLWGEPSWAENPTIQVSVYENSSATRRLSYHEVSGYPQAGSLGTLLDCPEWTTPAATTTPYPLHDPLEFEAFDEVPYTYLPIYRGSTRVWNVHATPGTTSLRIPEPPSCVNTVQLFGTSNLIGYLRIGALDWDRLAFTSVADAVPILLEP